MYLIVGVLLGLITYVSWMGYYFLYLPKKIRNWFEKSMGRLFILDAALTIIAGVMFASVSNSLTAVIAASVMGALGTLTTVVIRIKRLIFNSFTTRR